MDELVWIGSDGCCCEGSCAWRLRGRRAWRIWGLVVWDGVLAMHDSVVVVGCRCEQVDFVACVCRHQDFDLGQEESGDGQ